MSESFVIAQNRIIPTCAVKIENLGGGNDLMAASDALEIRDVMNP